MPFTFCLVNCLFNSSFMWFSILERCKWQIYLLKSVNDKFFFFFLFPLFSVTVGRWPLAHNYSNRLQTVVLFLSSFSIHSLFQAWCSKIALFMIKQLSPILEYGIIVWVFIAFFNFLIDLNVKPYLHPNAWPG